MNLLALLLAFLFNLYPPACELVRGLRTACRDAVACGAPQERSRAPRAKTSSFHRLLLRFDALRRGFEKCHVLFKEIDTDRNGVIDLAARAPPDPAPAETPGGSIT